MRQDYIQQATDKGLRDLCIALGIGGVLVVGFWVWMMMAMAKDYKELRELRNSQKISRKI